MNHNFKEQKELLFLFVFKSLRKRYFGSFFGFLWTVIHPFIVISMYTLIFSVIMKVKIGRSGTIDFGLFLFCGMLPWFAVQDAIDSGLRVFKNNAHIIKKMKLPLIFFPLESVITALLTELVSIVLIIVFLLIFYPAISINPLLLLLIIPFQFMLTFGIVLFVSIMNIFFRDTIQITQAVMTVWFFGTPIIYIYSMIPEAFQRIIYLNPLTSIVNMYRAALIDQPIPEMRALIFLAAVSGGTFAIGLMFHNKLKYKLLDYI